jgi:hypothetical protein
VAGTDTAWIAQAAACMGCHEHLTHRIDPAAVSNDRRPEDPLCRHRRLAWRDPVADVPAAGEIDVTQIVEAAGIDFAYRRFGQAADVPLVREMGARHRHHEGARAPRDSGPFAYRKARTSVQTESKISTG